MPCCAEAVKTKSKITRVFRMYFIFILMGLKCNTRYEYNKFLMPINYEERLENISSIKISSNF